MHVGASFIFQNPGKRQPDHVVWEDELAMVDLIDPLGFDSVWATEHHITDYIMSPDPLQFLAYAAGRTKTAKLGTMVVVLPWREPFRTTAQVAMLDTISGGRVIFGMGRGAGRCEFEGFGIPMNESRARFVECAEMILGGLESGYCEYDGQYYRLPRPAIRPRAARAFKGRSYAAAV
ncbi:MAG: LLM class flavin-dependent oxidoreductase, partial [Rhodospirillaceae bacterium]|nr:LLM class flavin-dependent oxidoreductase [Rhodospirillaceae bacterium]